MDPESGHFAGFSGAGWKESGAVSGVFWGWRRGDPEFPCLAFDAVFPGLFFKDDWLRSI